MQPAHTVSRIILLTGEAEAPILSQVLRAYNTSLAVDHAQSVPELEHFCSTATPGTRLLSFCSSVIVPGALLAALPGPSYNFHPGPPERPGRYPSVFALYENAPIFGVTAHEMLASVDSGAIIAAEWFELKPEWDLMALEEQTLIHLITLFHRLAPHLALHDTPLMHQPVIWRGRKTTKADCEALCAVGADMSSDEIERRHRACGGHMLHKF